MTATPYYGFFCKPAAAAGSAWTIVQSAGTTAASLAFGSNNTAGNLLVALINTAGTAAIPTDTAGNTWLDCGSGLFGYNAGSTCRLCYVPNCKAGANTVSSTGAFSINMFEINGARLSGVIDAQTGSANASSGTGNNNATCGPITTIVSNDFIVAGLVCLSGPLSAGTGWTSPKGDNGGLLQYKIQSSAGSISATGTDGTSSDTYAMAMCAFEPINGNNIAFRASSSVVGTGTNAVPAEPAGTTQNDILIAISVVDKTGTMASPSGWNNIFTGSATTLFNYSVDWVRRGASAPSLTWVVPVSKYREVMIACYSGVKLTGNPYEISADGGVTTGTGPDCPQVATTSSNDMVLAIGCNWAGGSPYVAPSGYTIRSDNTVGNDCVMGEKKVAVAGNENPAAFTGGGSQTQWQGTIALVSS